MKQNKKIIYNNFIQKEFCPSKNFNKFNNKFNKILDNIIVNLNSEKNSFSSLGKDFKLNFKKKDLEKFNIYKTVVVIGMGGSILGVESIYNFLKKKINKQFIFINNIDENNLIEIKKKLKFNKVLFIVISKSGNTIETISNVLNLKIIKKKNKNIIIISEKKNNPLYLLAKKNNIFYIEHKSFISGRYSIFSETGAVPMFLMGINILRLRKNILNHFKLKNRIFLKESSIKLSNILKKGKIKNIILFNYVPELNKFLYWTQQLIAESLGKKGKGFLPVISPAPKDHHSLLQLYLDGPKDKIFYIFSTDIKKKDKKVKNFLIEKIDFLNSKSLSKIKMAQKNAFLSVLKKKKIPFREFKIMHFSEEILGELFSYFILETAIIGKLSNINPFNQPAVEEVKISTKKILL